MEAEGVASQVVAPSFGPVARFKVSADSHWKSVLTGGSVVQVEAVAARPADPLGQRSLSYSPNLGGVIPEVQGRLVGFAHR